jgi:cation:H+ antiporter
MTADIFILAAGFGLLYVGGEGVVRGAAAIGMRLGITPVMVGLIIVAFGTSAPELAVSIRAALGGHGGLAIGNVVGSNICNIALILGLTALIRPPTVQAQLIRFDVPVMIGSAAFLILLLIDGTLSRLDGAVLVFALLIYLTMAVKQARAERQSVHQKMRAALARPSGYTRKRALILALGLAGLIAGGDLFVRGAVGIAVVLDVPESIIGLSIVALGTSLPELATSVVAALRGHGDIAAGNVIGSNIFNVLSILGITAVLTPLPVEAVTFADLGIMFAIMLVALPLMFTQTKIERWEGGLLLAIYVTYMAWLFSRV